MLNINRLKNKKIAVLGMGVNNEKLTDFLLKNNLPIVICDRDENKKIKLPRYSSNKLVSWKLGEKYLNPPAGGLENFDIVFRSPGIQFLNPKIQKLKKQGVEISSQTKLFFELCPAMIIGVTGTKGKGTTSTLIYEMLKKSGKRVFLAGNIGQDPFNYLEKLKKTDIIILELSSFQLQDLDKSPHIAVVLNITVDHLDHHKDREEYLSAKTSIAKFQNKNDYIITNVDYQDSKNFSKLSKSKNLYFSVKKRVNVGCYYKDGWLRLAGVKAPLPRRGLGEGFKLRWFGVVPRTLRTEICTNIDVSANLGSQSAASGTANQQTNSPPAEGLGEGSCPPPFAKGGRGYFSICSRKDIKLLGRHNLENISAAVSAAIVAGASIDGIRKAIKSFRGLEHRLEYAGKINGVQYYNDSFSTTPQTAIAAINSFDAPIILIAGGSDKGADFTLLASEIVGSKVKAVILIGDMAENILNAMLKFAGSELCRAHSEPRFALIRWFGVVPRTLRTEICTNIDVSANLGSQSATSGTANRQIPPPAEGLGEGLLLITGCKTMRQIVKAAHKISKKGDIVLMSPACASFDMFKNYKERGELFKREVKKLNATVLKS